MSKIVSVILILFFWCCITLAMSSRVPILAYHKFAPTARDSMTISTAQFAAQLKWIKDNGYTVIPLMQLVRYLRGDIHSLPPKSVVITDDDGRKSVYTYMLPMIQQYHYPVTLFIYPQIISHPTYGLTWTQLKALQKTGLFTVEGHTYWHPNFRQEKKRLSQAAYDKLIATQLVTSKRVIENKLGTSVTLLAWPFGIHDAYLEKQAEKSGYLAAFSIAHRKASRAEKIMEQPRYMIIYGQDMKTFQTMLR